MNPIKAIYCRTVQAVLDASLTRSLPLHLTATTGMDALTHAVEAYIGRSTTRETREKALEANPLYPVPRLMTKEELEGFYRQVAAVKEVRHGKQAS